MNVTDRELIQRYVNHHDHEAFASLVGRHSRTIRSVLLSVLNGNVADVEEVEQEVLIALSGSLHKFSYRSAFSTWLYRFCRNRGIDYVRKSGSERRKRAALQSRMETEYVHASTDPVETLEEKERIARVQAVLQKLKERERTLLVLKDMNGLTIEEIAKMLRLPSGTVKSRLHRARIRAAGIMEKMYENHV